MLIVLLPMSDRFLIVLCSAGSASSAARLAVKISSAAQLCLPSVPALWREQLAEAWGSGLAAFVRLPAAQRAGSP
jgi:hypothetical protein